VIGEGHICWRDIFYMVVVLDSSREEGVWIKKAELVLSHV